MKKYKIFLDTNILQFGTEKATRLVPRKQALLWGEKEITSTVYKITDIPLHEKIKNDKLYNEIKRLPEIAKLSKDNKIDLVTHFETIFEQWGLPHTIGRRKSYFDGVKIDKTDNPIEYSRVIARLGFSGREMQSDFLQGIRHRRFIELQKATGAYQGKKKANRNQLLDAFHIWCAEQNQCDYFLTLDFKLIDYTKNQKKYKPKILLVYPSELIKKINLKGDKS